MKISKEQVHHIARLANLECDPDDLSLFTEQLDAILRYFDRLKDLPTDGIEPTFIAAESECPLRKDRVAPSLPEKEALKNAPEKEKGYFKVPKVIG
jgi:aspartyl-tRNA(Asn)/glutamyl-tRNA(Gln) amidotransferase subunit C